MRPLKAYLFIFITFFCFNASAAVKKECQDKEFTIYGKETCIHCLNIKKLLKEKNLSFKNIDITGKNILLSWLYSSTKQSTIPFVYMNDKFLGGFSDFKKLCIE